MELLTWRTAAGLTQRELAAAVGVSAIQISRLERRSSSPSVETARRIEVVTKGEVTAAELLGIKAAGERRGVMEESKHFDFDASDDALLEEAASYGLDAAEIARAAVERAVKAERMKRFSEENREAIESWNQHYKKHGLWNEKYRLF
ncbi:type II toxin-antitoxin system CcdA family antitoxin [Henriciella marina]|uniref:Type II toxin-antitoxin system CcdA family antitoxin n=1 Tax=Henriciella marina TaxID=453851 RepID=A0ABT4LX76_9PROT|nr:helix-turn-helix domain-containing protein [Henriciella marina]MCZ4298733.1 type II toxin-antitoxin system CcdA family antitoxin [Henriciella marina]